MAIGRQLRLFGTASGRGQLFAPGVLNRYIDEHSMTPIPDMSSRVTAIRDWLKGLAVPGLRETSLHTGFITRVLALVLGYVVHPSPHASLYPEPGRSVTGIRGVPDAILGQFGGAERSSVAVVELKGPGADLDAPQAGYGGKTPVEQALEYGYQILGVRWVIVSNMRVLRLYSIDSTDEYEEISLDECCRETARGADSFRRLHFIFNHAYLVAGGADSQISRLHSKSVDRQLAMRDGFYSGYYQIRADLYSAIAEAAAGIESPPERPQLLEATQRLLDRMLFLFYCEDHPQQLIPRGTVAKVTGGARALPGPGNAKVYEYLKQLFREVDVGSPPDSGVQVNGYNGELFKHHPIIDCISLPDSLHDRRYTVEEQDGKTREIRGVWGLHVYDFWNELNEHLLGHIFEESLSDLQDLGAAQERPLSERLAERKRHGIFYTTSIVSDFLVGSALQSMLDEDAPLSAESPEELLAELMARRHRLLHLRVVDPACGSGAFLSSAYGWMLQEFWRLQSAIDKLAPGTQDLFERAATAEQATILRDCLFGADLLPQAVEIAKLALWLRSARKGEKVADLGSNIVAADSLEPATGLGLSGDTAGTFDLVVGNPPWGGEVDTGVRRRASEALGLPMDEERDSWELFVLLALSALKTGGRLALVLPDSFLYPEKARTRQALAERTTIEKVHSLGPDWFGAKIRMGTVLVQARRGQVERANSMLCMLLTGTVRRHALTGRLPLSQAESQRSRHVPFARVIDSPTFDVEVFRGGEDDLIMQKMVEHSTSLRSLCDHGRGEEMSKSGLVWECPSCLSLNTPGAKRKGGGYVDKDCRHCGHRLTEGTVRESSLVKGAKPALGNWVPFIDGDDVSRRYRFAAPTKWLRTEVPVWPLKSADLYRPPKILIRQAGVGIAAVLDDSVGRCPQSVYVYRLCPDRSTEGYRHEYVLAALLSRTMAYYVLKRFGETDPAKAFPKLTHERLADLPIPRVDFTDIERRRIHDGIVANATALLSSAAPLGGTEDLEIEQSLRYLWGLDSVQGAYINGEFSYLPEGQFVRDLFPSGLPQPLPPDALAGDNVWEYPRR